LLGAWAASRLAIGAGVLLKARLLMGALRLEPDAIRHQGVGQLLGRVLESSSVETLGSSGGLLSSVAVVEILICTLLLARGAGSTLHAPLFIATVLLTAALEGLHHRRRRSWTNVRLSMTHDLVERMVGHRTRITQEPRSSWHDGEDQVLERCLVASRALDRAHAGLLLVPQAWTLAAVAALGPELVSGSPSAVPLAIALGGILLGRRALTSLTSGITEISGAVVGWQQAEPLVRAAAKPRVVPTPTAAAATSEGASRPAVRAALLHAEDLRFVTDHAASPSCAAARSAFATAIASSSRVPRAAESRRSPRSSRACGRPSRAFCCSPRSQHARRGRLAPPRRRGPAVPREPRLLRALRAQPAHGPRVASAPVRSR
jgi:ATP-binding cassette subfamily B protein